MCHHEDWSESPGESHDSWMGLSCICIHSRSCPLPAGWKQPHSELLPGISRLCSTWLMDFQGWVFLSSQGSIFWGQFEQNSEIGYPIFLYCCHLQTKEHDSGSGKLSRSDPSTRKTLTFWSESRGGPRDGQELEDKAERWRAESV